MRHFRIHGPPAAGDKRCSLDGAQDYAGFERAGITRVRAAESVLDHAKQAIEIEYVEIRVAAVAQAAELSNQDR